MFDNSNIKQLVNLSLIIGFIISIIILIFFKYWKKFDSKCRIAYAMMISGVLSILCRALYF
jgi:hypothetical protein